ncbi:MAG: hypothetical protein ABSG37_14695 [Candidatus Limnocylindrales bacterium]
MPPKAVDDAFPQLIIEQLTEERARKTSLEQRGVGVITTSGALVTLLFGLSALATKNQAYVLPDPARWTLILVVALFLVASVLGLMTNVPLDYFEPTTQGLSSLVEPGAVDWPNDATERAQLAAEARVTIIQSARHNNGVKAAWLLGAMLFEVVALIALAIAVGMVLWPA